MVILDEINFGATISSTLFRLLRQRFTNGSLTFAAHARSKFAVMQIKKKIMQKAVIANGGRSTAGADNTYGADITAT